MQLLKRWKSTETVLSRAYAALPSPTKVVRSDFEAAITEYRESLKQNELELALDALASAAELVGARGGVWRNLERAAQFMELSERAAGLHSNFLRAVAGASS